MQLPKDIPDPDWQDSKYGIALYRADCLDILPTLPKVDAVVTDPPYGVKLKYAGGFNDTESTWRRFVPPVVEWADATATSLVMFAAAPTLHRDVAEFHRTPDRMLIWAPAFSLSQSRANGIFYRWHPIYCWNLPKRHNGPCVDVLRHSTEGHHWWNHPGTKPLGLMRECVGVTKADGVTLDPFMGSGTTGVAAINLGRAFIGIEIEATYFEIAVERIRVAIVEAQGAPLFAKHEPAPLLWNVAR